VDVGLAADIGTLQRFPKVTGNDSLAREFALTGRKFNAKEAREIGFVSQVIDGGRAEVLGELNQAGGGNS
jgi:delta(3,5)-delta(2,4)-dienoyl-CoA isomerase